MGKTNAERKAGKAGAPRPKPRVPQPVVVTITFPNEATRDQWIWAVNEAFKDSPQYQIGR